MALEWMACLRLARSDMAHRERMQIKLLPSPRLPFIGNVNRPRLNPRLPTDSPLPYNDQAHTAAAQVHSREHGDWEPPNIPVTLVITSLPLPILKAQAFLGHLGKSGEAGVPPHRIEPDSPLSTKGACNGSCTKTLLLAIETSPYSHRRRLIPKLPPSSSSWVPGDMHSRSPKRSCVIASLQERWSWSVSNA